MKLQTCVLVTVLCLVAQTYGRAHHGHDGHGASRSVRNSPLALSCNEETEQENTCGNACEATCGVDPQGPCEMSCQASACECKPGLRRNDDGNCVEVSDCPATDEPEIVLVQPLVPEAPVCDEETEDLNPCGSFCEGECGVVPRGPCEMACVAPACACKIGYKRNSDGNCVMESECIAIVEPELTCPTGEIVDNCGNLCERKCGQPEDVPCILMCAPPACNCDGDLVRDENTGLCVEESECTAQEPIPELTLPENPVCNEETENLNPCGSFCEGECGVVPRGPCEMACVAPACACKIGYKRNPEGNCVMESDCPGNDVFWFF